ncbi:hypothetical protein FOXG_16337 [Fusarium oxysporum f. sp. lycopersici 4287]|uniref:Uncharacterized protein n=2 Tax=Fusarium oxysporum TaxID=5507 RepID=A0A0J9V5Z0_FUSO4|nr:hypothetical protein FOXG_06513 [Fusarium oxysporum f. sp. lycopersici 4287]XP_018242756.1 hypothetical protein FOXG_06751 [Fusarium oxysporum f. sp. lycopersici 4287]XP_018244680.1 hypothetical protein FOXG_07311 [Fusarium oxysporum f. sp. lycopersici 4287]XP_018256981.1 uncharacterized protein FOXG_16337 [Fusarium oxysporum f. sp. lycopersici 4287]KAJ9419249.1 hypothetical protein QL093DRAFT_2356405 [Fusarium oxysporum]KNB04383.1 hypothetical protein FOXG_06513 [Fusarium oxysporum f. sp. 
MINSTSATGEKSICPFAGNPDLYGIGIRIGFYLQWISTLLATLFAPWEEDILRILNLLVQLAMFLGLVFLTQDGEIHAIEPVITLWLSFGALSSLSGNGINPLGRFSGFFRVLVYSGFAGYACRLWFSGLDDMLEAEKGCRIVAFFGGVTIEGSFRKYNKVAAFIGAAICATFAIASVFKISNAFKNATYRKRYNVEIVFLLFSFTIIILSISVVEWLVRANGITSIWEITAVGQLLPLLSGIFGLLEVLYGIYTKRLWEVSRCWVLLNHHLT